MMTGVVAGFGEPIGAVRLEALWAHGLRVIRQDIHGKLGLIHRAKRAEVLAEGRDWEHRGGRMLWIVDSQSIGEVPQGSWIEYLNEPEYLTPKQYVAMLNEHVRPVVARRNLTLWAGSIGNLDEDSLCWLKQVDARCNWLTHFAVHRYTPGTRQNPREAHRPYRNREQEMASLRCILGTRPFLVSEVGYHTARTRRWWFWHTRLTPAQQTERLRYEQAFWDGQGAEAVCFYQERDADGETLEQYGLVRADGTWKMHTAQWGPYDAA